MLICKVANVASTHVLLLYEQCKLLERLVIKIINETARNRELRLEIPIRE